MHIGKGATTNRMTLHCWSSRWNQKRKLVLKMTIYTTAPGLFNSNKYSSFITFSLPPVVGDHYVYKSWNTMENYEFRIFSDSSPFQKPVQFSKRVRPICLPVQVPFYLSRHFNIFRYWNILSIISILIHFCVFLNCPGIYLHRPRYFQSLIRI